MSISFECPSCSKKLKAADSAVGKQAKCPQCGTQVTIPEKVYDAEEVGGAESDDEYGVVAPLPAEDSGENEGRRPCPACGEMIVASALKCRFCGEVFDETLRREEEKKADVKDVDKTMQTSDWVICLLCPGIGCIGSVIYLIQGKPKALKMLGICLLMNLFWGIVRVALTTLQQQ